MGLILLIVLVAWFIVYRTGGDVRTLASRGAARAADHTANAAANQARRAPTLAPAVATWLRAKAKTLRDRPAPTTPRTEAGEAVAAGGALLLLWLRLLVADASAAADASRERRANPPDTDDETTTATGSTRTSWARWPRPGEPGAPIHATAERLDQPAEPAAPPSEPLALDAEIVPDSQPAPDVPELTRPQPAAITTGGTMTNPNTPATTATGPSAGEGGLGSYLQFWNGMVAACEQGAGVCESTLADMTGNDWSGLPIDSGLQVQELLANAREAAAAVVAALEASLSVADSYAANSHTGTKESVTAL